MAPEALIHDLRVEVGAGTVALSWSARGVPAPRVRVLRSTEWYPQAADDAVAGRFCAERASEGVEPGATDSGLDPDRQYFYSLFARRRDGSWCPPVQARVWTSADAPAHEVHGDRARRPKAAQEPFALAVLLPVAFFFTFVLALVAEGLTFRLSLAACFAVVVLWRRAEGPSRDRSFFVRWLLVAIIPMALVAAGYLIVTYFGAALGVETTPAIDPLAALDYVLLPLAAFGAWQWAGLVFAPRLDGAGFPVVLVLAAPALAALVSPEVAILIVGPAGILAGRRFVERQGATEVPAAGAGMVGLAEAVGRAEADTARPAGPDTAVAPEATATTMPVPLLVRSSDSPATREEQLLWVLVALWLLNFVDFMLTWVGLGNKVFTETNVIMAHLYGVGNAPAFLFKMGVATAACLALWLLRRHALAFRVAVLLTSLMGALVLYEAVALLAFS